MGSAEEKALKQAMASLGEESCISIIVISYNEENNIKDCLDSLTALDYPPQKFEILLVDSSTDSTPRIASAYPRVRIIRAEKGYSQQRNVGLKAASFEIVAFTDADCIVPRDWLRVINRSFRDEKIAGIGGNAFPPPGSSRFEIWVSCVGHPSGGAIGFDANVRRSEKGVEFVAGCNSAFRKEALLEIGGFDPSFYDGGEDVDLSGRMRKKGYFLDYIPELTVYHKSRKNLWSYLKWNVGVGVTKFNLNKPTLIKIILHPSFPLWSLLFLMAMILTVKTLSLFLVILISTWLLTFFLLLFATKPYPLLLKRRKKIGASLLSVLTVIPFLIYLRQISINVGQLKKWIELRGKKTDCLQ